MVRFHKMAVLIATFVIASSSRGFTTELSNDDGVRYALVVFDGATSDTIVEGDMPQSEYDKWFRQDYPVGGERIETPESAKSLGALIIVNVDRTIVMPLCSWQSDSENTYFACQSDAIGRAPMFRVCIATTSKADFLNQVKLKLADLSNDGL